MKKYLAVIFLAAFSLSGCLSGGSGSTATTPAAATPPATISFPLQSAEKTWLSSNISKTITISGSCSGSASISISPSGTTTTFEGVSALSAVETDNFTYTNCSGSGVKTITSYFDSNYTALGSYQVGVSYSVKQAPPIYPTSVTVGATGIIGSENFYTNNTKTTLIARIDQSYVIEADPSSSSTAIEHVQ